MSRWLDQIKGKINDDLSKIFKDANQKVPPEEWAEFESWFWKIRPHLTVDWSLYNPTNPNSETSGPNAPRSTDLQPESPSV